MQVIKAVVIAMGALILIGLGILAYGLTNKFGATMSDRGAGDATAAFGTIRAALPAGATVSDIAMQDGTVVVHLTLPDGGAQIMVFRLSDGRQTGTIELQPQR
ncbi:MAG: hypothetical protein PVG24_01685 [Gammaproteobacteria bacterium]|jgi:hypothetical protein